MPWIVPVNAIVHRNTDTVIVIQSVAAYPNGFVVDIGIRASPHRSQREIMARVHTPGARLPRVGVRFSDGRTAGRKAVPIGVGSTLEIPKGSDGIPTEPIVRMTGGGGGPNVWRFGAWVYPLPPDGPLEVFVSMPVAGLDEGNVVIDGGEIRTAAQRATVVWS